MGGGGAIRCLSFIPDTFDWWWRAKVFLCLFFFFFICIYLYTAHRQVLMVTAISQVFSLNLVHYLQEVLLSIWQQYAFKCQIAHKEWVHCLLGEMVANWYSWLSAIRGHGALDNKCALHNSDNIAALCRGITLHCACDCAWQEHYWMYYWLKNTSREGSWL